MRSRLLSALVALLSVSFGQTGPAFEVATIKPHDLQSPITIASGYSPLRFTATGTLRDLLRMAYGIQDSQISGGPGWLQSDRFDIEARPQQLANADQHRVMLRTLLADRFKLALHHESRELSVYALAAARSGSKLGAAPQDATSITTGAARISGRFPLSDLARYLSQTLGRTVVDQTGLAGVFEIKLEWMPDEESLFTAIQEQLGLRLEPAKEAVDVLVIDHVEKPSGN
jgi:uncharacterized protein (TIGR03435 family)